MHAEVATEFGPPRGDCSNGGILGKTVAKPQRVPASDGFSW
jgi:hypothetical protein